MPRKTPRRTVTSPLRLAGVLLAIAPGLPHAGEEVTQEEEVLKPAQHVNLQEVVSEPLAAPAPVQEAPGEAPATPDPPPAGPAAVAEPAVDSPSTPDAAAEADPAPAAPAPKAEAPGIALRLLHSEVPPGTATRLAWAPEVGFIGASASTAVLAVNGIRPGPTVCLTAAIHGDELNGIEIVRQVLYDLDPEKLSGAVIGVPIVNLEGFRRGSRYLSDRRDLNRYFPGNRGGSAAARIAHSFFNEVIAVCDVLIDLHTGSFRRTNLPQLRADLNYPAVEALTREMGSIVVLQSKGARGSLRRAATENGIPAVTLEAGAPQELQKSAVDYGVKSVNATLSGLGLTRARTFSWRTEEPVYYRSTWIRAQEGGILFSDISLGARVAQGELLGVVTNPITNERSEIRSPFSGRVIGMALNQVMHPGYGAYHLGIEASVDDAVRNTDEGIEGEDTEDGDVEAPGNLPDHLDGVEGEPE